VRKALVITVLAVVVLAGSAAAALQRYDTSRSDEIAEGISVAGVDVGGMTLPEARTAVRKEVAHRLDQPLRITHLKRKFTIDPALVDVRTNVDALLQSAMAESREGNFLTRSFRDLTGRTREIDFELEVEYSQEALARVIAGIRREVQRPARDATSSASFAGVYITPSEVGVAVRPRLLRNAIVDHLVSPDSSRTFAVPVRIVRPKVTTKQLKERYGHFIAISRSQRELRLFVNQRLVKTYRVGIGAAGFDTPAGQYEVETKAANPAWYVPNREWAGDLAGKVIPGNDPDNPIKARWMGFYDGAGIHGTSDAASIGGAASHGCIRMLIPDVIDLYERVPLHTPLSIA
jgi:L,D-transpeptidase catalytic domain/Putative peptidoglycan binding domain